MIRNRLCIVFTLILLAALLAGCSADALQKSSGSMESLGNAGFGTAGGALVDESAVLVGRFIADYEECFTWEDPPYSSENGKAGSVLFKDSADFKGEDAARRIAASLVKSIRKAVQTKASDEALRQAISAKYPETGKSYDETYGVTYRKFGEALEGSVFGSNFLSTLSLLPLMYPDMQLDPQVMEKVRNYEVPIPLQAYDLIPMLTKAMTLVLTNMDLITFIKNQESSGQPGASAFDITELAYITEGIAAHTGDRTYQTVGDKMTVCLLNDIIDVFASVLKTYNETHTDYEELGFEWVLKACPDQIDRAVSDLNTIAYINGIHIDIAGLIGTYVSRI